MNATCPSCRRTIYLRSRPTCDFCHAVIPEGIRKAVKQRALFGRALGRDRGLRSEAVMTDPLAMTGSFADGGSWDLPTLDRLTGDSAASHSDIGSADGVCGMGDIGAIGCD